MALLPPLTAIFLLAGPAAGFVLLAAIGGAVIATFSVTIVIGHDLLPGHIGVASGFTLGLAIGIGGVSAPLLGLLADAHGPGAPLHVLVVLPILALGLALTLPGRRAAPAATPA
jgi:FSR family fosmidomycin resistance protein-like MFS transporter